MDGKTAVVTGASRGLGREVARLLAAEGAHVVACARSEGDLEELAGELDCTVQRADVRDEFDMERFAETAARAGPTPGIDLLVANAGVYHGHPGDTPLEGEAYSAFDDHLRTNVRGVYAAVRESVPHLAEGARVFVPSGGVAREARTGFGSYAVSKAGAEAVARQFAAELDATVGVLDMGFLSTELTDHTDQGRDPADVADMVVWAATEADPAELDGAVTGIREWKTATR
jgi:NAD(P)-dependent dehydrogenase (short-subunit alcohol dehydrogenase family)